MSWHSSARARSLATAALLALVAAVLTGHAVLVLLAAPALGALALLPRRRPPEPDLDVTVSGSRCFEGEEVTVTATVRAAQPLDEVILELQPAAQVALVGASPPVQAFVRAGRASARWVIRPERWGRPSPGTVRVTGRAGALQTSRRIELEPLEVFPQPVPMRPRLVPAELLRRIGEHTGRAVGDGVEFAGIRPYLPGDQLRDVNRAVSLRRGQLHVNQRAAARAAGRGGLFDAAGDRQFYRIAEMMLAARYDSFVTPDVGRIPRTALPPGTLVVVFSPLLDPRGFGAISDLRQRGFPLIVVDTLRDEPSPGSRADARLALRLWRLDRAATRAGLRALGVPVLGWDTGTELDSVLAPLRQPPPGVRRLTGTRP
jgi:uncharacterized protein (DUF58 family)